MGWSDELDSDIQSIKTGLAFLLHDRLVGRRVSGFMDVGEKHHFMQVEGRISCVDRDLKVEVSLDEPALIQTRWTYGEKKPISVVEITLEDAITFLTSQEDAQ